MENIVARKEWLLKKNCTLSPKQFGSAISFVGGLSLIISVVWAFKGVWVILPFAFLECVGLLLAFLVYSRHATDFERVILTKSELFVEREIGGFNKKTKIPRSWISARFERNERGGLIFFRSGRVELNVGQFVSIKKRELFFDEIKGFL